MQKDRQWVSAYSLSSWNIVCKLVTCQNGLSLCYCSIFSRLFYGCTSANRLAYNLLTLTTHAPVSCDCPPELGCLGTSYRVMRLWLSPKVYILFIYPSQPAGFLFSSALPVFLPFLRKNGHPFFLSAHHNFKSAHRFLFFRHRHFKKGSPIFWKGRVGHTWADVGEIGGRVKKVMSLNGNYACAHVNTTPILTRVV